MEAQKAPPRHSRERLAISRLAGTWVGMDGIKVRLSSTQTSLGTCWHHLRNFLWTHWQKSRAAPHQPFVAQLEPICVAVGLLRLLPGLDVGPVARGPAEVLKAGGAQGGGAGLKPCKGKERACILCISWQDTVVAPLRQDALDFRARANSCALLTWELQK